MNAEGYRDPTADTAIKHADRKTQEPVIDGYVPPSAWKILKPALQALHLMGFGVSVKLYDHGQTYEIRWRR